MAGQAAYPDGVQWDVADYQRRLSAQIRKLKGVTEQDVLATAITIVNRGKSYAAVDTGLMRSTLTYQEKRDSKGYYCEIVDRAPYWKFVEFGTRYMAAQPFMRPAFSEGKQFLIARVKGRR